MFNRDFAGFDLSNLSVLELTISTMNPGRSYFFDEVHSIHSLFTVAASLTHRRTLSDNTLHPVASYEDFLSGFPILKSLEVNVGFQNAGDPDGVSRANEKALRLVLERLVRHGLYGDNFSLCSESLKILDVHTCFWHSIARLDCPSLEELVCQNPIIIGGIGGSAWQKSMVIRIEISLPAFWKLLNINLTVQMLKLSPPFLLYPLIP